MFSSALWVIVDKDPDEGTTYIVGFLIEDDEVMGSWSASQKPSRPERVALVFDSWEMAKLVSMQVGGTPERAANHAKFVLFEASETRTEHGHLLTRYAY